MLTPHIDGQIKNNVFDVTSKMDKWKTASELPKSIIKIQGNNVGIIVGSLIKYDKGKLYNYATLCQQYHGIA